MTLGEIINMISMKYPHSYGESYVITMINDIQQRLFRTMFKLPTVATFDLLAGEPAYPIDFSADGIVSVVADGADYPNQNIKYTAQDRYYYVMDGSAVIIYPTPDEDVTEGLKVIHYKEPATLSGPTDTPEMDKAWHMLLVNYVCRDLAEIEGKDGQVRYFTSQISELERQYYRSKQARPHRILDVYDVGRGAK